MASARDILKTVFFAALHFTVGFAATFGLTGSLATATGVALLEPLADTVVFYFHERAWRRSELALGLVGICHA